MCNDTHRVFCYTIPMPEVKHLPLRRIFQSRLFVIIAMPLSVLIAFGYARSYYQGYKIKQEIKALQDEVSTLERKKIESLEILKYVQSDDFVERQAREELSLSRPGEKLLVVTNRPAGENSDAGSNTEETGQRISNAVKWWRYFSKDIRQ